MAALGRAVALGVGDGRLVALGAVALGTRYDGADRQGLDGSTHGARRSLEKRARRSRARGEDESI